MQTSVSSRLLFVVNCRHHVVFIIIDSSDQAKSSGLSHLPRGHVLILKLSKSKQKKLNTFKKYI